MIAPTMGTAGRALTEIAPFGWVEVEGVTYRAERSMHRADPKRPPIPANGAVVVCGWRVDHEQAVILLVRDPAEPAVEVQPHIATPVAVPHIPTVADTQAAQQEKRLRSLERQLAHQRSEQEKTKGCLYGMLGFVLGAVLGWCPCGLPFKFLTERAGKQERVTVFFADSKVYETAGGPGTKQTVQFGALVVMCGGLGLAGGLIGAAFGGSRSR